MLVGHPQRAHHVLTLLSPSWPRGEVLAHETQRRRCPVPGAFVVSDSGSHCLPASLELASLPLGLYWEFCLLTWRTSLSASVNNPALLEHSLDAALLPFPPPH